MKFRDFILGFLVGFSVVRSIFSKKIGSDTIAP